MSPRGGGSLSRQKAKNKSAARLRRRKAARNIDINTCISKTVLNEIDINLTYEQKQALQLGTKFLATSRHPANNIQHTRQLLRKINLAYHWADNDNDTSTNKRSPLSRIIASRWNPPNPAFLPRDEAWKAFEDVINSRSDLGLKWQNTPANVMKAWENLQKDTRLYILQADKGGKTVLLSRAEYHAEALRQLSDTSTYKELTKEEVKEELSTTLAIRNGIINNLLREGCITRSEAGRAKAEPYRIPPIYGLPKIHKEKRADSGTYPLRLVLSASAGPTKILDMLAAEWASLIIKKIPGSLEDTRALIIAAEQLQGLPPITKLFSADVEALYPSIDWNEGIAAAVNFYGEQYPYMLTWARNRSSLLPPSPRRFGEILSLVLKHNFFHFRDTRWFHQLKGTAMGCSISVFLANTFMYQRTRYLIDSPPERLIWMGRYIDDIVGVYAGELSEVEPIFARTIGNGIKLTYVWGDQEIEALDIRLKLDDGRIILDLYEKEAEGHQYLHSNSGHPAHMKPSIVFSQLLRYRRNISSLQVFKERANKLLDKFRKRGYEEEMLQEKLAKVCNLDRTTLFSKKPSRPANSQRMNFVLPFHPATARKAKPTLKKLWRDLDPGRYLARCAREGMTAREPLPTQPPRIAWSLGNRLGSRLGPIYKRDPTSPHFKFNSNPAET